MMNHLFRRQIRLKFYGLTIALLTIALLAPAVLSAGPTGLTWLYWQSTAIPDPGFTTVATGGANDSDNNLYGIGFFTPIAYKSDVTRYFIYKLNRNDAGPDPAPLWEESGSYVNPDYTAARGVATDRRKDVYVVGETKGRGASDAFIRKYSKTGSRLWTRTFHKGDDIGHAVAADSARNVYMVGITDAVSATRGTQGFIRKYNKNGRKLWTRRFGSAKDDGASAVAVDRKRNVYVAGITNGGMGQRFGGPDGFLRKYSRTGKHLWTRQFGTPKQETGISLKIDGHGKIYVAGATNGTFRGRRRRSGQKFFLRKYNYKGKGLWTRQFGRASASAYSLGINGIIFVQGTAVTIDSGNNVYVSGTTPGGRIHVQKFNRRGISRWARDPVAGISADLTVDNSSLYLFGERRASEEGPFVAKVGN